MSCNWYNPEVPHAKRTCPLCESLADATVISAALQLTCGCGEYFVRTDKLEELDKWCGHWPGERSKLSALCRERALSRAAPYLINVDRPRFPLQTGLFLEIDVMELLRTWPRDVPETLDRALLNISRAYPEPGQIFAPEPKTWNLFHANDERQCKYYADCLLKQGLIQERGIALPDREISALGWARVRDLNSVLGSRSNPAFVAMWFEDDPTLTKIGEPMSRVYHDAIKLGIEDSGYVAHREDIGAKGLDFIMDSVVANIRRAPFVVADFTGNRAGVYFEAGLARGFGSKVIHACHEAHAADLHFDVKQLRTIIWRDFDALRKGIHASILANIGPGPGEPRPPPSGV